MARVVLTGALRDLAGGVDAHEVQSASVAEALEELVAKEPKLRGWILDEQARLRQHVIVFVNQERARLDTALGSSDQLSVIPAITGGADELDVELLVGTRKGLFVLRGRRGERLEIAHREFAGQEVTYAMRDPRSGRCLASVVHGQFGPHLFHASEVDGEWQECAGPVFPEGFEEAVERTWTVVAGAADGQLWAGVAPAALFESRDGGLSWMLNRALWEVPERPEWRGGGAGLALQFVCPWPGDSRRLAVGISAAGVWLTEDGGQSWRRGGKGIVSRYLPDGAKLDSPDQCVHNLQRSPAQPEMMYMQFHGGVYRSDDAGLNWRDIGSDSGLPADFGFPLVADPRDPDRAWVIPLTADTDRVTVGGEVQVYQTRDRGRSWSAQGAGLPGKPAYLTVLRHAFCSDAGDPLGLYFGATSGDVWASADSGEHWHEAARYLPPVLSVRCA